LIQSSKKGTIIMFLFKPNIQDLREKKNIKKLEKALHWTKGGHIIKDAVLALFDLGQISSVEKFIETAKYPSSYDMKYALEEIGAPAIGSLLALIERGYDYVDELATIGSLSVKPLLSLLSDNLKKSKFHQTDLLTILFFQQLTL
ncbi:hypothetical protein KKD49_05860, partial [Myxococcota bacterium]|nr:hypothetical protein [Myxococcota bacterium]